MSDLYSNHFNAPLLGEIQRFCNKSISLNFMYFLGIFYMFPLPFVGFMNLSIVLSLIQLIRPPIQHLLTKSLWLSLCDSYFRTSWTLCILTTPVGTTPRRVRRRGVKGTPRGSWQSLRQTFSDPRGEVDKTYLYVPSGSHLFKFYTILLTHDVTSRNFVTWPRGLSKGHRRLIAIFLHIFRGGNVGVH